jgi:hypothetical protein
MTNLQGKKAAHITDVRQLSLQRTQKTFLFGRMFRSKSLPANVILRNALYLVRVGASGQLDPSCAGYDAYVEQEALVLDVPNV